MVKPTRTDNARRITPVGKRGDVVRPDPNEGAGNPANVNEAIRLISEIETHMVELSKVPLEFIPPAVLRRLHGIHRAAMRMGRHKKGDRNIVEDIIEQSKVRARGEGF